MARCALGGGELSYNRTNFGQQATASPAAPATSRGGAGIVEAVGKEVTQLCPGDPVVASWNPHCGHCFYCERDLPILCEPFTRHQPAGHMLDGASRFALNGAKLHHFSVVSSHAEYMVVPESGSFACRRPSPSIGHASSVVA